MIILDLDFDDNTRLLLELLDWKTTGGTSERGFKRLCAILKGRINLPALSTAVSQLQGLTGIKCTKIHCCIDSCIAFTEEHAELDQCPCGKPRYLKDGVTPQSWFLHIPLPIRLILQYSNVERANILKKYRAEAELSNIGDIENEKILHDFWDAKLYNEFHRGRLGLFHDEHDIALHLSLDGVQVCSSSPIQQLDED